MEWYESCGTSSRSITSMIAKSTFALPVAVVKHERKLLVLLLVVVLVFFFFVLLLLLLQNVEVHTTVNIAAGSIVMLPEQKTRQLSW